MSFFVKNDKTEKGNKQTNESKNNKIQIMEVIYNHQAIRGRLCSIVIFAQNHAKGQGCFLSSTGDVCLCGRIYQQTSSHAIIWRPQEALISGGKESILYFTIVCMSVQHWAKSELVPQQTHSQIFSQSVALSLALRTFSFLMVLVEIERKRKCLKTFRVAV